MPEAVRNAVATGYFHPGYAEALSEFGTPVELPHCKGWFLRRSIPGTPDADGMGCYPYFVCEDWSKLRSDLDALGHDLVAFSAAPDPFGRYTTADLQRAFPDRLIHFKEHYVADLTQPLAKIVSRHHRRYASKARQLVDVEFHTEPVALLDRWMALFEVTVRKFRLGGIRAFSIASFARQLALPGCVMAVARHQGEIVAAHLYMVSGEVAHAHLAATANEAAHQTGAAYAMYSSGINYFAGKVRWIDWGGDAGLAKDGTLSAFKRGWSTGTRPAYFCGRIFDAERYARIAAAKAATASGYFPAYRAGELC
ncbi:MAG: GNAT family N-acetyltransferase [Candidatus Baltobacteraceae bacterium]